MDYDAGIFFDKYSDIYGKSKTNHYDYYFVNFIKKSKKSGLNLLDIGGGSGIFAQLIKDNCINIDVTVIDPSEKLLNKINDESIKRMLGRLPNQILLDSDFDYIHVNDVFHHIVGPSIGKTRKLLIESLFTIKNLLKEDGFVLIRELFYESYLIPILSRTLIFYLLALQNKYRIKLPSKEFLMDLEVCFYTRPEFESILKYCGFEIIDFHEGYWGNTFKKRALFLRNWGTMLFIVKKAVGSGGRNETDHPNHP